MNKVSESPLSLEEMLLAGLKGPRDNPFPYRRDFLKLTTVGGVARPRLFVFDLQPATLRAKSLATLKNCPTPTKRGSTCPLICLLSAAAVII